MRRAVIALAGVFMIVTAACGKKQKTAAVEAPPVEVPAIDPAEREAAEAKAREEADKLLEAMRQQRGESGGPSVVIPIPGTTAPPPPPPPAPPPPVPDEPARGW